jgi:hypothetical protein
LIEVALQKALENSELLITMEKKAGTTGNFALLLAKTSIQMIKICYFFQEKSTLNRLRALSPHDSGSSFFILIIF